MNEENIIYSYQHPPPQPQSQRGKKKGNQEGDQVGKQAMLGSEQKLMGHSYKIDDDLCHELLSLVSLSTSIVVEAEDR